MLISCWSDGNESFAALALLGMRLFTSAAAIIIELVKRVVLSTSVEKIRREMGNVAGSECNVPLPHSPIKCKCTSTSSSTRCKTNELTLYIH